MDFWSRLIAGTSLSPSTQKSKAAAAHNPEKRLQRFKREYNQLLQIANLAKDNGDAEILRSRLQGLTSILNDESRRPSPHTCLAFTSHNQAYVSISEIATTSYNELIIREAVSFFTVVIESEEEDFLENDKFSKSLMDLLVHITGANSIRLSSETESEVVELAFGITTKIRLQPEILPAWFAVDAEHSPSDEVEGHEKFTGRTHKEDFPLFYLLIDYIHHEGRVGDFARTGLLYIIESASTSVALEQWIVDSDLATLMATGLGALYSQLSRKLVIDYPSNQLPAILALSDYTHPVTTSEIESSVSPDFMSHMETFLSHLVFWQDVLEHCNSVEVKSTLLEHFQMIFLRQLLYPSLLESSDIDGGSSVAVLTYLRRILESLDHPEMIQMILHYLLSLPDAALQTKSSSLTKVSAARRRKSLDLATMMASKMEHPSGPELFNLVDLILGSLRSENQQTVAVTLQLLSVILRRHHRYAVITLLRTGSIHADAPSRTVGAHEKEIDFFVSLAGEIGAHEDLNEMYEDHLKDSLALLESHPCSIPLIAPKTTGGSFRLPATHAAVPGAPRDVADHTLRHDDPVFKTMINVLENFFANSIETNLCLTAAIVDLAACGYMHIQGWLVPDPSDYEFDEEDEARREIPNLDASSDTFSGEEAQLLALRKARRQPKWKEIPILLKTLQVLVQQVNSYRTEIPRFDDLLEQRRDAFHTAATAPNTPATVRQKQNRLSFGSRSRSTSPRRRPSAIDSLAQRIFPDLANTSRASSPRGRRGQDQRSSSNMSGAPVRSMKDGPPSQFPMSSHGPGSSGTSSRALSPNPLRESRSKGVPNSQLAAFAAIDQSILARKVALPSSSPAIPFPNLRTAAGVNPGDTESAAGEAEDSARRDSSVLGSPTDLKDEKDEEEKLVTVSHVLTNVLVLQEFLLELAALVQVRASLFGEIKFA